MPMPTFELVKQYGGVPLKLEPSNGVINYTYTRNSEEECFAQIISDFEKAYELLPEEPEDKQLGRLTKSAAATSWQRLICSVHQNCTTAGTPSIRMPTWLQSSSMAMR